MILLQANKQQQQQHSHGKLYIESNVLRIEPKILELHH